MTQPTQTPQQNWIQNLLQRYRGMDPREGYSPIGFTAERAPFDTSNFFRELETFKHINKAATAVTKQRAANQRQIELEKQQRAIDLSGVTPKFTGAGQHYGSGKTPKGLGQPLRNYNVSSGYGPRNKPTAGASSWHRGADLAAPSGSPIYATHSGVVAFSGWGSGYGYNIAINGARGMQTFYGHNSKNVVKAGQQIRQGQLIGYVGSTGVSTGPHLHYEVRINGKHVN